MQKLVPDNIHTPQSEWDKLDQDSRQFLIEAEKGGLQYIAEDGEVCAWGVAYEGLFSMDVEVQQHPTDKYLITLAN